MGPARENLRLERDRFVAFAFSAAELLLEVDERQVIRYASGANSQLTGRDASTLVNTSLLELFVEADRKLIRHALARLGPAGRLEPISVHLDNGGAAAILGACSVPSARGRYFVSLVKARARSLTTPKKEARDETSGTWNRTQFFEVATQLTQQGKEEGREDRLTVLQLGGLDELRQRAGDSAVDELLSEAGAYLRAQSIGGDAVGRLADDKYGIVHDAAISPDSLSETVDAMAKDVDPSGIGLSLAKGCMSLACEGISTEDISKVIAFSLQTFGDQDVGKLDMMSMSEAFDSLVHDTANRLTTLRETLAQKNFQMVFQPIVGLSDREVHHYEVLSRFPDTMGPAETVQFAERTGLIEDLDLAVCDYAISVIQDRLTRGDVLRLAINISGRSFGSDIFARLLNELLGKLSNNRRELLFIEVTETAQLESMEEARKILQGLREQGHIICLDDFGSGASSFRYVQTLPVDFVKIDGSYVKDFLDNSQSAAVIRSMVSLAQEVGAKTIAEMVETEPQARGLKGLGVDLGQGWLFGRPQQQVPTTSGGKRKPARAAAG